MDIGGPRNADVNWNAFDATSYLDHNYKTLRGDDKRFIIAIRDYFAANPLPAGAAGIDVGSGTNLYPALAMVPFVERLTLLDISRSNLGWLEEQVRGYGATWDPFWATLGQNGSYAGITDPRAALRRVAEVRQADLFEFTPARRYDIGTMFFVAESISGSREEFECALARFLAILRPGAPFAAAFMENSVGYRVGGESFPAVRVDRREIGGLLSAAAEGLSVHYEPAAGGDGLLRPGYDGMILAVGRTKLP